MMSLKVLALSRRYTYSSQYRNYIVQNCLSTKLHRSKQTCHKRVINVINQPKDNTAPQTFEL